MTPVSPIRRWLIVCALCLLAGCEWSALLDSEDDTDGGTDDGDTPGVDVGVAGMAMAPSSSDFISTDNFLRNRLATSAGIRTTAFIDHRAYAARAGLDLRPTRLRMFAVPSQAAPPIQAEPLAGLDLPQKMLVYGQADDDVTVAFNGADYLRARHGLSGRNEALEAMDDLLTTLAQDTAGNAVETLGSAAGVSRGAGIVIRDSNSDFTTTVARLRGAINANPELALLDVVDHQTNAASVGLGIDPNALFVFGNPELGTPLMQAAGSMAIDLPQKMLVYQTEAGEVRVAYNDPVYLAARHGIDDEDAIVQIDSALDDLATAAASGSP